MIFLSFLDKLTNKIKQKSSVLTDVVNKASNSDNVKPTEKAEDIDEDNGWVFLPTLTPLSLDMGDSVVLYRKKRDEDFAKRYNLALTPAKGYEI